MEGGGWEYVTHIDHRHDETVGLNLGLKAVVHGLLQVPVHPVTS